MRIEELTPGQPITFIATIREETMEFPSRIMELYPKKRLVLADPVYLNEKVLYFRGKGLIVDLLVTFEDIKPQLFKNIQVSLMKKADKSLCYNLSTIVESKPYNRRKYYRCYVGVSTSIMYGANRNAHEIVIKDVSADGFSFVCGKDVEFNSEHLVHVVLNDYLEEIAENFSFHLYGFIVRSYETEGDRIVYGCRLNNRVAGLESYIMKKERIRIQKTNGGKL